MYAKLKDRKMLAKRRNEYGKQIRKQYENHEIKIGMSAVRDYEVRGGVPMWNYNNGSIR